MSQRVTAALAAVVLVLVVVGIIAASVGLGNDHADRPAARSGSKAGLEEAVAELSRYVVAARHHEFKHAVPVTFLDQKRFRARLLADAGDDKTDVETSGRVLRAVGLLSKDDDLYSILLRFVGESVVGFYDPKTGQLVLRGTEVTPYVRATLVHELTHALDDQWFTLERPALDHGNDEAALAFTSLVEGNAVRVEEAFRAGMRASDRARADAEEARAASDVDVSGVPRVVQEAVTFPYVSGPRFVHALLADGGEPRVDAALQHPPTTSADILDPASWLAGRRPRPVAPPAADGPVVDKGIFGQSSLQETLEPVVGTEEATSAAAGWAGDAYVAWSAAAGSTCVRATFAMRDAKELDELTTSLRSWATDVGAMIDRGSKTVTFTSCS